MRRITLYFLVFSILCPITMVQAMEPAESGCSSRTCNGKLAVGLSLLALGTALETYAAVVMPMFQHWRCESHTDQFLCCPANLNNCGAFVDYPNCGPINQTPYCMRPSRDMYPAQWGPVDWALGTGIGTIISGVVFLIAGTVVASQATCCK